MPKLKDKIDKLPPELKKEVDDFVTYLINKNKKKKGKIKFDWENSLSNIKDQYNSVELQHKTSQLKCKR